MPTSSTPNPAPGGNVPNPQADLIQKFISKTRVMVVNGQIPALQEKLQNRGYPKALLQQKEADLDQLSRLNEAQQREYGEQYQSTANYKAAEAEVHEDYEDHLGYARLVFKANEAARKGLGIKGMRHRNQAGYAAQGLVFYNNLMANGAWMAAMAAKGVEQEELQRQQEAFSNLARLEETQQRETGEAQGATAARDVLYKSLQSWAKEMRKTARIALRKYPQLSEQIGIKDPS